MPGLIRGLKWHANCSVVAASAQCQHHDTTRLFVAGMIAQGRSTALSHVRAVVQSHSDGSPLK